MKLFLRPLFILTLAIFLLGGATTRAQESTPSPDVSPSPAAQPNVSAPSYYNAHVIEVTPADEVAGQATDGTVLVHLVLDSGPTKGRVVSAEWNNNQEQSRTFTVDVGQKVIVMCITVDGQEYCDILDQQRLSGLIALIGVFLLAVWFVTKKHGLKSVVAMIIGVAVILAVIVPLILKGVSPILVTILGGLLILIPTVYVSHGISTKSHIGLVSIVGATVFIAFLAYAFSQLLGLNGSISEETNYLAEEINLRSVLLSAIILGALGVVDDIAMTQVSIVNALHHSNPKLTALQLFSRAMRVGQDHIASVINTLFLAYAGVSLPLLILIQQSGLPGVVALQQEPVATEIMRTLVGTIGLILVVPITTFVAAKIISRYPHRFPAEASDAHAEGAVEALHHHH